MRALLQRVTEARVDISGQTSGIIAGGWVVLLGVGKGDTVSDSERLAQKILSLRLFSDSDGRFNLSVQDVGGSLLVVSQFTLYADCRKGRRPSFTDSAPPAVAKELYEYFVSYLRKAPIHVETGIFGADMNVYLVNHGPVSIWLDTKELA